MRIVEYAKSHPIAVGAIVIIGGIIFILIVRGGGGGSSGAVNSGPSDAEIALEAKRIDSQAAVQAATIQAAAVTGAAQIGAGVQLNSDNKAAEVAMAQIGFYKEMAQHELDSQTAAVQASIDARTTLNNSILSKLGSLKKKNRDDVLQALATGEQFHGNGTSSTAQTIGAVGYAAQGIGNLLKNAIGAF